MIVLFEQNNTREDMMAYEYKLNELIALLLYRRAVQRIPLAKTAGSIGLAKILDPGFRREFDVFLILI